MADSDIQVFQSGDSLPATLADNRSRDHQILETWLKGFRNHTLRAYKREAERLMMWAETIRHSSILDLNPHDLNDYLEFLKDPQPTELWVADRNYHRDHEKWRPFTGPLKEQTFNYAVTVIKAMYADMVQIGFLKADPSAWLKKDPLSESTQKAKKSISRYLTMDAWNFLRHWIDRLPENGKRDVNIKEQALWIFNLLYKTGMRRDEVVQGTMGDLAIEKRRRGNHWVLTIHGKGHKVREIPAPKSLMDNLSRYRRHLGLSPLPLPDAEDRKIPLVLNITAVRPKKNEISSPPNMTGRNGINRSSLYSTVKWVFDSAASSAAEHGMDPYLVEDLKRASTHWMRHTTFTHMADLGSDLVIIKDMAGHKSLATTSLYTHADQDKMREAMEKLAGNS